ALAAALRDREQRLRAQRRAHQADAAQGQRRHRIAAESDRRFQPATRLARDDLERTARRRRAARRPARSVRHAVPIDRRFARGALAGLFAVSAPCLARNEARRMISAPYPAYEATLVTLFGLIIGSFMNVCIYRIPRHLSPARP